ncbi:MAG TPA: SDR family oxidoreductase [Sedimentisphaerales bacterium]|nr:SDR family oxidoreductase [Sedimentisphaerales bacterium]
MIDPKLKDKVVIVTGANHGIGAATAIAFAKQEAKVFINYFRPSAEAQGCLTEEQAHNATEPGRAYYYKMQTQSADEVVKAINDFGGICYAWEADLSGPDNIPKLFDKAREELGQVDILVNNAAYGKCDTFIPPEELNEKEPFVDVFPIAAISASSHDEHFSVNSRAVALMMAEYAKRFVSRKARLGRIINISSDGAFAHPSAVSYGASKYATESYTRAAATELGPYGITVNVISPGAVQTGWIKPELEKQINESYPLKRMGKPEDIANAIIFLASEQANWITGQVLYVGGGNRM